VHEKLRLLYVACTRGRDHLIVSCHHKVGDGSYANRVWDLASEDLCSWRRPATAAPAAPAVAVPTSAPPAVDDRQAWIQAREALLAPQRRPRFVSATTIAGEATAGRAGDDDLVAGPEADDDGSRLRQRRRGRAGTAIGRAAHATLQLLDLAAPSGIDDQAVRQAHLEAIPEHAGLVAAMVRSALASAAVREAADAVHHKEIYVAAPVGGRVVEGYVDLLIEGPGGLVIVDYKTDTVRSEGELDEKLSTYEVQGAAYAVAIEEATGLQVVDCRFVFCRPGGAVERSVTDLEQVKQRVRELAG
jgi:ATP-dependent helicase/nuclease subunit A